MIPALWHTGSACPSQRSYSRLRHICRPFAKQSAACSPAPWTQRPLAACQGHRTPWTDSSALEMGKQHVMPGPQRNTTCTLLGRATACAHLCVFALVQWLVQHDGAPQVIPCMQDGPGDVLTMLHATNVKGRALHRRPLHLPLLARNEALLLKLLLVPASAIASPAARRGLNFPANKS